MSTPNSFSWYYKDVVENIHAIKPIDWRYERYVGGHRHLACLGLVIFGAKALTLGSRDFEVSLGIIDVRLLHN